MTPSRGLRLYRACQRCRRRKLKCEPTVPSDERITSCFECVRAGEDCILAGSRRGGDFTGFRKKNKKKQRQKPNSNSSLMSSDSLDHHTTEPEEPTPASNSSDDESSVDPVYADLRHPRDALEILVRLASGDATSPKDQTQHRTCPSAASTQPYPQRGDECLRVVSPIIEDNSTQFLGTSDTSQGFACQPTLSHTETLVVGVLGADTTKHLLTRYARKHHTFCPLASKSLLEATDLRSVAVEEPFLLTVILTIASKDEPVYRRVHQQCWQYLKPHLIDIMLATPSTMNVGTVEGLLLLAEWVPYAPLESEDQRTNSLRCPKTLTAIEDHTAWSFIGQAVRHAYLLRLDQVSFKSNPYNGPQPGNRERLAWIFVYIADRQISVRIGQSFWSRGPSLSSRFTANDFPSLRSRSDEEHNYAMVLQATIELTQLLHNAHDILYSSKERTANMILRGDYNRYLDDFRTSLSAWKTRWSALKASPKLDCTLRIFMQYVCLYVNAFSFQAILSRATKEAQVTAAADSNISTRPPQQTHGIARSLFPEGIMASPDGVYVLEAIDAARSIVSIANQMDPVEHMRFMPFRFYVYTIYAAVFLYKVVVFGAMSRAEHEETASLMCCFISLLDETAPGCDEHVGNRYGRLLKCMWAAEGISATLPLSRAAKSASDMAAYPSLEPQNPRPAGCEGSSHLRPQEATPNTFGSVDLNDPSFRALEDFNLFCPEFSALETEFLDLGVGESSIASLGNGAHMY